jgi:hypothetical protein
MVGLTRKTLTGISLRNKTSGNSTLASSTIGEISLGKDA